MCNPMPSSTDAEIINIIKQTLDLKKWEFLNRSVFFFLMIKKQENTIHEIINNYILIITHIIFKAVLYFLLRVLFSKHEV